jgi:hypothetical protein
MSTWSSETKGRIDGLLGAIDSIIQAVDGEEIIVDDETTEDGEFTPHLAEDGERTPVGGMTLMPPDGVPEEDPLALILAEIDTKVTAAEGFATAAETAQIGAETSATQAEASASSAAESASSAANSARNANHPFLAPHRRGYGYVPEE